MMLVIRFHVDALTDSLIHLTALDERIQVTNRKDKHGQHKIIPTTFFREWIIAQIMETI